MVAKAINEVFNAPLPEMVERLGRSIAEAQYALDKQAIDIAALMSDKEMGPEINGKKRSLLELGFTPSFYHFTEATIEAKVAFSTSQSEEVKVGASVSVAYFFFAASINASYTNKFSFDANGASSITARLVSVPPPQILQDILRAAIAEGGEITTGDNQGE